MIINILKKDLNRKRTMNLVLFVFITLCTMLLVSSISNLMVTMNALDYFATQSELSDYFIDAFDDELTPWLTEHENVIQFEVNQFFILNDERVVVGDSGYELEETSFLSRLPQELNIPLDLNNQPLNPIETGEIAINFRMARQHNINLGDMLYVEIEGLTHAFEVTQFAKDILTMLPRMFISDDDFTQIEEVLDINLYFYAINVDDLDSFTASLNQAMFSNLNTRANAAMIMNQFAIDLMLMGALTLVGICLIAISFVVLRFVIVFTLQEDYKEIGIMKAIGLKNKNIKKVYLIKYLFLACLGSGLGFALNFPFGEWLLGEFRENIAFPSASAMVFVQLFSTLSIILLILSFCYMSTKKLNKFTAMQAIRSGETGERFKRKSFINLHRMKRVPTVVYLALNDILSNVKSYMVLLVVFILGFLLAIIPLNISNTLDAEKLAELRQLPVTDVYFDQLEFENESFNGTVDDFRIELEVMEAFYHDHGLEIDLQAFIVFRGMVYTESIYEGVVVNNIIQTVEADTAESFQVLRGEVPMLSNEVALTEMVLDQLGIDIGDEVNLSIDGMSHQFLVTGSYQTLIGFGVGVFLSEQATLHDGAEFSGIVQGNFVVRDDIESQIQQLEAISDDVILITLEDYIERSVQDVLIINTVRQLILIAVTFVNILIITLMSKLFMIRDMKQMALIKSLGFSNQAIKWWQGLRILLVMAISLLLGVLLVPVANVLASIPFDIMGAPEISLNVDAVQVFVLYPLIFLIVTGLVLSITTLNVKKVGLRDMGNTD